MTHFIASVATLALGLLMLRGLLNLWNYDRQHERHRGRVIGSKLSEESARYWREHGSEE